LIRIVFAAAVLIAFSAIGYQRRRQGLARLEEQIRKLRLLAVRAVKYRPAEAPMQGLAKQTEQLEQLGCTLLGDMIEESATDALPTRWFLAGDKTTFGWIALAQSIMGPTEVAMLMSVGERATITMCSPRAAPGLAQPPHIDRVVRVGFLDLKAAFAEHAKRKPEDARTIESIDDALAAVEDVRSRTATWREAQAPQTLLDRDLRSVLGQHYDKLGKTLAKRLATDLPEARVRA